MSSLQGMFTSGTHGDGPTVGLPMLTAFGSSPLGTNSKHPQQMGFSRSDWFTSRLQPLQNQIECVQIARPIPNGSPTERKGKLSRICCPRTKLSVVFFPALPTNRWEKNRFPHCRIRQGASTPNWLFITVNAHGTCL
jgi:hypothetical protein